MMLQRLCKASYRLAARDKSNSVLTLVFLDHFFPVETLEFIAKAIRISVLLTMLFDIWAQLFKINNNSLKIQMAILQIHVQLFFSSHEPKAHR